MKNKINLTMMFLIIVVLFSTLSIKRNVLFSDSLKLWKDVTEKSPSMSRVWTNYGLMLARRDRCDEAIVIFDTAVSLDEWQMEPHFNLGVCYIKKQMYDDAIDSLEYVVKINDVLTSGHFGVRAIRIYELQARSNLGNLYTLKGDYDKAIYNFNKVLLISPDNVPNRFNLAMAYKRAGKIESAIRELQLVLEKSPGDEGALYNLRLLGAGR